MVCEVGRAPCTRLWEPLARQADAGQWLCRKVLDAVLASRGLRARQCRPRRLSPMRRCADPAVLALAARFATRSTRTNPYPKNFTGHIRAVLKDGRVVEERQPHMRGGAQEPPHAPRHRGEISRSNAQARRLGRGRAANIGARPAARAVQRQGRSALAARLTRRSTSGQMACAGQPGGYHAEVPGASSIVSLLRVDSRPWPRDHRRAIGMAAGRAVRSGREPLQCVRRAVSDRGHCQSACSLFLLSIRNVCIEPSARLLFHAGLIASGISRLCDQPHVAAYNPTLRNYLVSTVYTSTLAFHTISGRDMIQKFGYRECPRKASDERAFNLRQCSSLPAAPAAAGRHSPRCQQGSHSDPPSSRGRTRAIARARPRPPSRRRHDRSRTSDSMASANVGIVRRQPSVRSRPSPDDLGQPAAAARRSPGARRARPSTATMPNSSRWRGRSEESKLLASRFRRCASSTGPTVLMKSPAPCALICAFQGSALRAVADDAGA